jgi:hypothetical protein
MPGKPSTPTIRQLKKELYANARSIHSDRGGGLNGHLGLVMPSAAYVIRAGAAFDKPNHPGIQPVHAAAATVAQITAANRSYDHAMDEFKTYTTITEKLKQQVLSAVDPIYYQDLEDGTFGYADVRIPAIITHLTTTYGTLTASDLETNRDKSTEAWNPGDPIKNLWKKSRSSEPLPLKAVSQSLMEPPSNSRSSHWEKSTLPRHRNLVRQERRRTYLAQLSTAFQQARENSHQQNDCTSRRIPWCSKCNTYTPG